MEDDLRKKLSEAEAALAKAKNWQVEVPCPWCDKPVKLTHSAVMDSIKHENEQLTKQCTDLQARLAAVEKDRDYYYGDGWKACDRIASLEAENARLKADGRTLAWIGDENPPVVVHHSARNGMDLTVPDGWYLEAECFGDGKPKRYVDGKKIYLVIGRDEPAPAPPAPAALSGIDWEGEAKKALAKRERRRSK